MGCTTLVPRLGAVPKVLATALVVSTVLDYLVFRLGLVVLPLLGPYIHPGVNPGTILEVYVLDALVFTPVMRVVGYATPGSGWKAYAVLGTVFTSVLASGVFVFLSWGGDIMIGVLVLVASVLLLMVFIGSAVEGEDS